jgi:hypothetical protein
LSRQTAGERSAWVAEWQRPQAEAWSAYGQEIEVALYVRTLLAAARASAPVGLRTLLLRQMDSLGLTQAGLRANRWILAADEPLVPRAARPTTSPARERLRMLPNSTSQEAS